MRERESQTQWRILDHIHIRKSQSVLQPFDESKIPFCSPVSEVRELFNRHWLSR